MSFLSQFFSGGKDEQIGAYGVGLATGFSSQIPVDVMLIGGGGGGGSVKNTPYGPVFTNIPSAMVDSYQGGGGGVGRVLVYNNCVVNTGVAYPITVGAGGAQNQRGGTSKFGILRSGGGGRGAGTNPDGTPQAPEAQDNWGGSEGGYGMSHSIFSNPTIAVSPSFYNQQGLVSANALNTAGREGKLLFSDSPISVSLSGNSVSDLSSSPNLSYLTNAISIFKQSVNSIVFSSPNFNGPVTVWPSASIYNSTGQGGVGGSLPHYVKTPTLPFSSTENLIFYNAYSNYFRISSVPRTQVQDSYLNFPSYPLSPNYPRNPLQDTKEFIADFFFRAGIDSLITDGAGGAGAGSMGFINTPSPNTSTTGFSAVTSFIKHQDGPAINFPYTPSAFVPANYDYVKTAIISDPNYNFVVSSPTPGAGVVRTIIPFSGGTIPRNVPYSFVPSVPFTDIPFDSQTNKLVTWTDNPLFDAAIPGGSPGNGGGGSGGNRFGPTVVQGTLNVTKTFPGFTTLPSVAVPYATNILATPLSFASGGAGGSGSVWVIYPTDYAAATVVGNTPVPSPPAFRIYRWDGAGSITFNAS